MEYLKGSSYHASTPSQHAEDDDDDDDDDDDQYDDDGDDDYDHIQHEYI